MNKKKLILKVEKLGLNTKVISDKTGKIKFSEKIKKGERIPDLSYWMAFVIHGKQTTIKKDGQIRVETDQGRLSFYKRVYDQEW